LMVLVDSPFLALIPFVIVLGWLAAVASLLLRAAPIITAASAGIAAYQTVTGPGPGSFGTRALAPITGSGGGPLARTRSEMERGQALRAISPTPGWEDVYAREYRSQRFPSRRMNVLNPRALNRSIRRVKGFAKFAKRVGSYTDPGKGYRLKGFGRKRKRR